MLSTADFVGGFCFGGVWGGGDGGSRQVVPSLRLSLWRSLQWHHHRFLPRQINAFLEVGAVTVLEHGKEPPAAPPPPSEADS